MKRRYNAGTSRSAKKIKTSVIPRLLPTLELKRNYQSHAGMGFTSIGNTWIEWDAFGAIIPGTGINARVGRRIAVNSVKLKAVFSGGAIGSVGADDYYNVLRLVIWTGSMSNAGGALTPLVTSGVARDQPINNVSCNGLIKVLYDQFISFTNQPYGANLCAPATKEITFFHRFKRPFIINYTGDGSYRNQQQIWIAVISDSTGVPNPGMIAGHWETTWYDN